MQIAPRPSAEYQVALELSAEVHRTSKAYTGKLLRPHRFRIRDLIERHRCRTALDYGCGRGAQYRWRMETGQTLEEFWGIPVAKFDPAYPPFAAAPAGPFDLVICTHVLGLIPEGDLGWVVDRLHGLAGKAIYLAIDLGLTPKAKKRLRRSASVPAAWNADRWVDLLARHRWAGIEMNFLVRDHAASGDLEQYVISDAGLRGPLPAAT